MKSITKFMLLAAAMGAMIPDSFGGRNYRNELTPEDLAQIERVRLQNELNRKKQRGMSFFNIKGFKIWALNFKNANRKYIKLSNELLSIVDDK